MTLLKRTLLYDHDFGSYQEIAYCISQGNKGYVYLICILKLAFLILTAALCLQYAPNWITQLIVASFYT